MSQKDQEAAIDERIERIRKRNEEIQRRYLEVEADKLNAEKLNAAVKFSPSPPKPPDTERRSYSKPETSNRNPRFERKVPDKPYVPKHQVHGKKTSFTENDKPPPDPVYTFLSDSSRDAPKFDHSSDEKAERENFSGDFRGSRGGGRGRGWSRGRGSPNRGGKRGPGNQPSRQSPQMQPDYQAWRAEREKIDQDRITRQKTAEGNWRREWDMKKLSQDEDPDFHSRPAYSKKKRRESDEFKIQRTVVNELASPAAKDQDGKSSEKSLLAKPHSRGSTGEKKTVAFKVNDGPSSENDEIETHETSFEHRNIVSCGDSIKIQLSNKPIKSVKVNPVNSAGTGRVGPRQKPRLSYSSQSEDEKEQRAPIFRKKGHGNHGDHPSSALDDASRKPPLPPRANTGSPKKQTATKSPSSASKESESPTTEGKELSRGSSHENISEAGDDSWEDVATTSGNESADFSDVDVTKNSYSKGDKDEESYSKALDEPEVEGNSTDELDEASALDSSQMEGYQTSHHREEITIDEENIPYEEYYEDETEQEVFHDGNLGDSGQPEDEVDGNQQGYDDHIVFEEDDIKSSIEVEKTATETCEMEKVNTSEISELKRDVVSLTEVTPEGLPSLVAVDSAETHIELREVEDVTSEKVTIAEENNSLVMSNDMDGKNNHLEVSVNKPDLSIEEEVKAQGNLTPPESENCINSKSESCLKEEPEGTDVTKVCSQNDPQPTSGVEGT